MNKKDIGVWGENQAVKYLKNKGYEILQCNFHSKFGEIDIIAKKDNIICFIEVKTRSNLTYGLPREFVNYSKQKKIITTAQMYIIDNFSEDFDCRFDIIEIFYYDKYNFTIKHMKGAFELEN